MGEEIERKFLVSGAGARWRRGAGVLIRQGYLCADTRLAVRVRLAAGAASFGVKAELQGIRRLEYEYPIPLADGAEMLDRLCGALVVEKRRYSLEFGGRTWEVDEFLGANRGLVIAEVELAAAEESVTLPPWVGTEVSTDRRYYNIALAQRPITEWSAAERAAAGLAPGSAP